MTKDALPPPLRGCLVQVAFFLLVVLFIGTPFLLLPMHPCPQPCCDLPGKFQRLRSIPGVSPQEAKKMLDWADPYPCVTSRMSKRVSLLKLWFY